jgi:hypothetical protein
MKLISVLVLLIFSNFSHSQDVDLYTATPDWEIGDVKYVHTDDRTTTYLSDTVFTDIQIEANYKIEIVDATDYFTILYTQEPGDLKVETSIEVLDNFIASMMKKAERELEGFDYKVQVEKETGEAIELVNSDEMLEIVKKILIELIDETGEEKNATKAKIKEMKTAMLENLESMTAPMIETILNGVTYLFQAYTYSFPLDETYSEAVDVYDINAMGIFGDTEFPSTRILESKTEGDDLTIQTSLIYDKTFLLEQMKKKSPHMTELTEDDLSISEKETVVINTGDNNWIKSHVSDVEFRMPQVYVVGKTVITYK